MNRSTRLALAPIIALSLLAALVSSSAFAFQSDDHAARSPHTAEAGNGKPGNVRGVIIAVANLLEIEVGEVVEGLRDGLTLGEIIEDQDGSVRKVVKELVELQRDRLQWAVDEDLISRRQMRDRLKQLKKGYTKMMDSEHLADFDKLEFLVEAKKRQIANNQRALIRGVADALKLEVSEVIAELREGSSLVDIIEDNDSTMEQVVDHMVEKVRADLLAQLGQ